MAHETMSSLCPFVLSKCLKIGENKLVWMDKDIEHSFEAIIRLNNMCTATYVPGSAPRAL